MGVNTDCICRCSEKNSIERNDDSLDTVRTPRRALLYRYVECNISLVCWCAWRRFDTYVLSEPDWRSNSRLPRLSKPPRPRGPPRPRPMPRIPPRPRRSPYSPRGVSLEFRNSRVSRPSLERNGIWNCYAREKESHFEPRNLDNREYQSICIHIHV